MRLQSGLCNAFCPRNAFARGATNSSWAQRNRLGAINSAASWRGFEIDEVSADKAYLSVENFEETAALGGQALIQFKVNSTGMAGGLFEKAFRYFQFNQEEYMDRYHKRSNVESTFFQRSSENLAIRSLARLTRRWSTKCFASSSATT
jgi:hypothetical protein